MAEISIVEVHDPSSSPGTFLGLPLKPAPVLYLVVDGVAVGEVWPSGRAALEAAIHPTDTDPPF